ncbi:VanZ family protein [Modestobacter muralis]|uniref:VanZ family protein n=1 Tax=Modestobacter muralis TaxID=1608614 RepID=A0A6P0EX84_9ACTN|nr:VanZ family protein [Modestobacter muralis]NEK95523.1 VanZ family protein [Modestobacter muralis]NEN52411.1 VanZ family protein [Modestobacter muralis]
MSAQHGALARGAFAVAVLVSLAVLFTPPSGVPSSPPGVDKVVHLSLFLVLALTARWAGVGRQVATVSLVAYAAVSEVVQGTDLVGRDAELLDWVADSAGVLLGLTLWALSTRGRGTR